jgi:hypothetical protein
VWLVHGFIETDRDEISVIYDEYGNATVEAGDNRRWVRLVFAPLDIFPGGNENLIRARFTIEDLGPADDPLVQQILPAVGEPAEGRMTGHQYTNNLIVMTVDITIYNTPYIFSRSIFLISKRERIAGVGIGMVINWMTRAAHLKIVRTTGSAPTAGALAS